MTSTQRARNKQGFSLIELVIVVVIIAIIGAIAIPRMSRGTAGAADSALQGNLSVLRSAIDLYATEHQGDYPSLANFEDQLTGYTNAQGDTNESRGTEYIYGPYLRSVPPLPVGDNQGSNEVTGTAGGDEGWVYDEDTGEIRANTAEEEVDASGTPYNEY